MNTFAPLHIRSGFSFLQSGLTIEKIKKWVKYFDYAGAGLSDNNVLHGLPNFQEAMESIKKPFALGMDLEIDGISFTLIIKNNIGYNNILKISTSIQTGTLSWDLLKLNYEGLILVLHTNSSKFIDAFNSRSTDQEFSRFLYNLTSEFKDDCYLGLDITSKEEVGFANYLRHFVETYPYKLVAFPLIVYPKKEDAIVLKIVDAISKNETLDIKKLDGPSHFYSYDDYAKIYTKKEMENTINILNSLSFNLKEKRGTILSTYKENSDSILKESCYKKLTELGFENNQKYIERVEFELKTIAEMGYSSYFLTVQDYVNWAKTHNILVAPGRGSAAGSLVSYLLNITEADPIIHDLQFERFLNKDRQTMPDIDVDFMDIKRKDVVDYLRERYGKQRVANIVAFQTIKAKQSLRDIGRVYGYPEHHISMLSKLVYDPKKTLAETYKTNKDFKNFVDSDEYFKQIVSLANKIEGLPRQSGQHAAGVILNDDSLLESTPVTIDFEGNLITQYEAPYLEEQHFLKMDILSLKNLTTIYYCVALINSRHPEVKLNANNIPYDDPKVYELLRSRNTIGIFQVETIQMRNGLKTINPKCFDDVVALLALNRPGPMAFMKSYARRRDGLEKYTFISDGLKQILGPTYGIIVYQEQVNSIARVMAGFTPSQADTFRRAISKKDVSKMNVLKETFIKGCLANGYSEKETNEVYSSILRFANYGFNKSHSVVYSMIACTMAYLKAYYPTEFYLSIMQTAINSSSKFNEYIFEMNRMGIKIFSPDVNRSCDKFVPVAGGIIFPLNSISYIDNVTAQTIVQERENNGNYIDFLDFVTRMYSCKVSENCIMKLINAGALDKLCPSRASMRLSLKSFYQFAELNYHEDGQLNIGIACVTPPEMKFERDNPMENLQLEYDVIKVALSNNPLNINRHLLEDKTYTNIVDLYGNMEATIVGVIVNSKVIKDKKGNQMCFMKLFDESGEIEVTIFARVFETCSSFINNNQLVIVKGSYESKETEYNEIEYDENGEIIESDEPISVKDEAFIADEVTLLEGK